MVLLYFTVPLALLAAGFLILGKTTGGWPSLDYLVYAMATGAAWAVVVLGYIGWVLVRDGWQASSLPAAVVLAAVALAAGGWWYARHAEEADCRAAQEFYARLAATRAADRLEAIRAGGPWVSAPSGCAIDGIRTWIGRDPLVNDGATPLSDSERVAVLALLLEAGLPPGYRLLRGYAVEDGDPEATRLLLRRRKALGPAAGADADPFPDDMVQTLITRARTVPGQAPAPDAARYQATLAVLVEEGLDDPSALSEWTRERLTELGLLP